MGNKMSKKMILEGSEFQMGDRVFYFTDLELNFGEITSKTENNEGQKFGIKKLNVEKEVKEPEGDNIGGHLLFRVSDNSFASETYYPKDQIAKDMEGVIIKYQNWCSKQFNQIVSDYSKSAIKTNSKVKGKKLPFIPIIGKKKKTNNVVTKDVVKNEWDNYGD